MASTLIEGGHNTLTNLSYTNITGTLIEGGHNTLTNLSYTHTTTGTLIEGGHNTLTSLRKKFFISGCYNYLGTN